MKKRAKKSGSKTEICEPAAKQLRAVELCFLLVLLGLGVYQSVVYFGHQIVPNPDFTGFVNVARQIASFDLPSSYKRLPVLGLLQIALSSLVGGRHPDLTAGWLLNAVLHPFNIVLIWLVGRQVIGKSALWVAVVAAVNPWTLQMLTEPIVETTLLFFILLTFYFIFKRSGWAYLFASAASMARYEGAILILIAFVMDMIYAKGKKQRLLAFLLAAAASVPLGLWMFGTVLSWSAAGQSHYLKSLGGRSGGKIVFIEYIELVWQVGIGPLFMLKPTASQDSFRSLFALSKFVTAAGFAFGIIYALIKRHWYIPALVIFLLPYLFIHAAQGSIIGRHGVAVYWMVLFICLYGFQGFWTLINKNNRIPRAVVVSAQVILSLVVISWLIQIVPYLPTAAKISPHSAYVPYVAAGAVVLIFILYRFIYKARFSPADVCISAIVCLIIVSNQFTLVRVMGTGRRDIEFRMLADWYVANVKGSAKMATTMANLERVFAPEYKYQFVHTGGIDANNPVEFVEACYKKDIEYVAWDSRLGLVPDDLYYKRWGLGNIAPLARPQDIGPYEFVTQIRASDRRFINIFRLKGLPAEPAD